MQKRYWRARFTLILFIAPLFLVSCQKLDEDGGYYDSKSGIYKYVFPNQKKALPTSELKITQPQPGVEQQIQGVITSIEPDLKSVWLTIKSRQIYMILAESLASGNRNDKDRIIRIDLAYVAPSLTASQNKKFRQQWIDYLKQILDAELLGQPVLIDITYQEISKKFWGVIYKIVETDAGDRMRNINKWMILQGYSYYIIENGRPTQDTEYLNAQNIAIQNKSGIWQYK